MSPSWWKVYSTVCVYVCSSISISSTCREPITCTLYEFGKRSCRSSGTPVEIQPNNTLTKITTWWAYWHYGKIPFHKEFSDRKGLFTMSKPEKKNPNKNAFQHCVALEPFVNQANFKTFAWITGKKLKSQVNQSNFKKSHEPQEFAWITGH